MSTTEAPASKRRKKAPATQEEEFRCRTSPRSIYNLVRIISEEQKQAIRDIGFGSILNLNISRCPAQLSGYLLRKLQVDDLSIILENGDVINIDEDDVQTVLNIPRGPLDIVESTGNDFRDPEYIEYLRAWRLRWGIVSKIGGPTTGAMYKRLSESRAGDENFKVDFTVLLVSLFLWGSKNQICRYKILKSLMDVDNIKNLNWCKWTLKGLAQSATNWKSNNKSHFEGPMTFLMVMQRLFPYMRNTIPYCGCPDHILSTAHIPRPMRVQGTEARRKNNSALHFLG